MLQDILGIAFCISLIRNIRLPNLKVCTILLVLLLIYDIFFVFITPLFSAGKSVMVEVATGTCMNHITLYRLCLLYQLCLWKIMQARGKSRDIFFFFLGGGVQSWFSLVEFIGICLESIKRKYRYMRYLQKSMLKGVENSLVGAPVDSQSPTMIIKNYRQLNTHSHRRRKNVL